MITLKELKPNLTKISPIDLLMVSELLLATAKIQYDFVGKLLLNKGQTEIDDNVLSHTTRLLLRSNINVNLLE